MPRDVRVELKGGTQRVNRDSILRADLERIVRDPSQAGRVERVLEQAVQRGVSAPSLECAVKLLTHGASARTGSEVRAEVDRKRSTWRLGEARRVAYTALETGWSVGR